VSTLRLPGPEKAEEGDQLLTVQNVKWHTNELERMKDALKAKGFHLTVLKDLFKLSFGESFPSVFTPFIPQTNGDDLK
jgi:hypothetical protein